MGAKIQNVISLTSSISKIIALLLGMLHLIPLPGEPVAEQRLPLALPRDLSALLPELASGLMLTQPLL
jgi:hypothetical protein